MKWLFLGTLWIQVLLVVVLYPYARAIAFQTATDLSWTRWNNTSVASRAYLRDCLLSTSCGQESFGLAGVTWGDFKSSTQSQTNN